MKISFGRKFPEEPTVLKDGLKWKSIKSVFHSEFRIIARDEWGDDVVSEIVETFGEAFAEFESQKTDVDAGRFASTEIEVILRWDDSEGLVEWDEIEIYHYGLSNYQEE